MSVEQLSSLQSGHVSVRPGPNHDLHLYLYIYTYIYRDCPSMGPPESLGGGKQVWKEVCVEGSKSSL